MIGALVSTSSVEAAVAVDHAFGQRSDDFRSSECTNRVDGTLLQLYSGARPTKTDRFWRGENAHSRPSARPSSPLLEHYVTGPSNHRPGHARACESPRSDLARRRL